MHKKKSGELLYSVIEQKSNSPVAFFLIGEREKLRDACLVVSSARTRESSYYGASQFYILTQTCASIIRLYPFTISSRIFPPHS